MSYDITQPNFPFCAILGLHEWCKKVMKDSVMKTRIKNAKKRVKKGVKKREPPRATRSSTSDEKNEKWAEKRCREEHNEGYKKIWRETLWKMQRVVSHLFCRFCGALQFSFDKHDLTATKCPGKRSKASWCHKQWLERKEKLYKSEKW